MSGQLLKAFMIGQIVISVLLVTSILLQNRAEGLGSLFGGGGEVFRARRGLEKFLYYFTIVIAVLFCITSFVIVKYTGNA